MTERITGAPNGEGLNLHNVRFGDLYTIGEAIPVGSMREPRESRARYTGDPMAELEFNRVRIAVDRVTGCMAFVGEVHERSGVGMRKKVSRYILDQNFVPVHGFPLNTVDALTPRSARATSDIGHYGRIMLTPGPVDLDPPEVREDRITYLDAHEYLKGPNDNTAAGLAEFVASKLKLQTPHRLALEHHFTETPQQTQEASQKVESELNKNFRLLPVKRDDLGRLVPEGTDKYGPAYDDISVVVDFSTGFVGVVGVVDGKPRLVDTAYEEIVDLPTGAEVIGFSQKGIRVRAEDGTCWNFEFTHPGYLATEITDPGTTLLKVIPVDVGHDITGDKIAQVLQDKELGIAQPRLFPGTFNESAQAAVARQEVTEPPALDENFRLSPVSGDGFGRLVPEGAGKDGPVYNDISVVVDPDTGIVGILGMDDDGMEYMLDAAYNIIGPYAQHNEVIVGISEEGINIKPFEMSGGDSYRLLQVFSVFEGHDITGDKIVEQVRELGIAEPRLFPGMFNESARAAVSGQEVTTSPVVQPAPQKRAPESSASQQEAPAPISPTDAKESLIHALQFALTDPLVEESGASRYRVINGLVTALVTRFGVGKTELKEIIGTQVLEVPKKVIETAGVVVEQLSREQGGDTHPAVVQHAGEVAEFLRLKAKGSVASKDRVRAATEEEGVGVQDHRDPVIAYASLPPKSVSLGRVSVSVDNQAPSPVDIKYVTGVGRIVTRKRPPLEPEVPVEQPEKPSPRVARLLEKFVGVEPKDDPASAGDKSVEASGAAGLPSSVQEPQETSGVTGPGGDIFDAADADAGFDASELPLSERASRRTDVPSQGRRERKGK